MNQLNKPIFWVDMEMTGLNYFKDKIIEVACALTDFELKHIIQGPEIIIHADKHILDEMDEWCTKTHKASGLYQQSLSSNITIQQAEEQILDFLKKNNIPARQAPLAGNSIHVDRVYMMQHMPKLDQYLHYRIIDVSSVKQLCQNWAPQTYKNCPRKNTNHRAMQDILESIEELRFYKQNFLSR